jgi:hypothetical protein
MDGSMVVRLFACESRKTLGSLKLSPGHTQHTTHTHTHTHTTPLVRSFIALTSKTRDRKQLGNLGSRSSNRQSPTFPQPHFQPACPPWNGSSSSIIIIILPNLFSLPMRQKKSLLSLRSGESSSRRIVSTMYCTIKSSMELARPYRSLIKGCETT